MKEVLFYEKFKDKSVRCGVCEQSCKIAPKKRGLCGVRENQGGKLYALNYGKAIAASVDPIEKKPLYHFLPKSLTYSLATAGCNLRCAWCQNWQISQSPKKDRKIPGREMTPKEHLEAALDSGCPSIAYTYTEPTIFLEYALDTMKLARKAGLKNIWVSNGYMSQKTLEAILPYLDAVNIDFKGPNNSLYQKYCGGRVAPVMRNLKTLFRAKVHLETTTLVIPGVNDQKSQLTSTARFIVQELSPEIPWHISRFFPAWKMTETPITPAETLRATEKIGKKAGLRYIYIGNV